MWAWFSFYLLGPLLSSPVPFSLSLSLPAPITLTLRKAEDGYVLQSTWIGCKTVSISFTQIFIYPFSIFTTLHGGKLAGRSRAGAGEGGGRGGG